MRSRLDAVLPFVVGVSLVVVVLTAAWLSFEPIRVFGQSMHPALHNGDLVVVERGRRAEVGEIALVRAPGRSAVLHRVVWLSGARVRTRGDANPVDDLQSYRRADVSGRVAAVVPVGRWAERWR